MLVQLLVAAAASICNIAVHALIMAVLLAFARKWRASDDLTFLFLVRIMIATVAIFMLAHTVEAFVWAAFYWAAGVVDSDFLYFALVNYTTLGYGDILPADKWRLLGPLTAMNGILLFGWSTAVIFEMLRRALARMDQIQLH